MVQSVQNEIRLETNSVKSCFSKKKKKKKLSQVMIFFLIFINLFIYLCERVYLKKNKNSKVRKVGAKNKTNQKPVHSPFPKGE